MNPQSKLRYTTCHHYILKYMCLTYIVIPGLQSFLVTVSLSLWCTGGSLQCASAVPGTVIGWGGGQHPHLHTLVQHYCRL